MIHTELYAVDYTCWINPTTMYFSTNVILLFVFFVSLLLVVLLPLTIFSWANSAMIQNTSSLPIPLSRHSLISWYVFIHARDSTTAVFTTKQNNSELLLNTASKTGHKVVATALVSRDIILTSAVHYLTVCVVHEQ